jgi:hypothetical protein
MGAGVSFAGCIALPKATGAGGATFLLAFGDDLSILDAYLPPISTCCCPHWLHVSHGLIFHLLQSRVTCEQSVAETAW